MIVFFIWFSVCLIASIGYTYGYETRSNFKGIEHSKSEQLLVNFLFLFFSPLLCFLLITVILIIGFKYLISSINNFDLDDI